MGFVMLEQQKIQGMSLDDFMAKYEEQPFELIDDTVLTLPMMTFRLNTIQKRIFMRLSDYVVATQQGEVFINVPYVIVDTSNLIETAKVPELMFISQNRLDDYFQIVPDFVDKPLLIAPDIVIEIMTQHDFYSNVHLRISEHLRDGVKVIWIVDSKRKSVDEFTLQNPGGVTKRNDDVLSGGDVALGFELKISEIFK